MVITIENGQLSWEVVNARNVDNVNIEIDHDVTRDKHNETIFRYLFDKDSYNEYLSKVCDDLGSKELSIVDRTFHSHSLEECTKIFMKCWWNKIQKKSIANDYLLQRMLVHDQRRNLMMWTMKFNQKKYIYVWQIIN